VPKYKAKWVYDGAGNRTEKKETKGAGPEETTSYVYDDQNRLTTETPPTGGPIAYTYDKNGNQAKRAPQGGAEERFAYDYQNRLKTYEKGPVGALTVNFLYRYTPTGERLAKVDLQGCCVACPMAQVVASRMAKKPHGWRVYRIAAPLWKSDTIQGRRRDRR
jgi:YD repeat-containing protein